jgi:hypothetical protein
LTFEKFVKYGLVSITSFVIVVVSFNVYINEFGLFGNVKGKSIRIYTEERTTKYLLSFNWIPQNFNAVLFGPSYSSIEMDTKRLEGLNVYNLSINGANISELKYPLENLIKSDKIKVLIVCLDPYLTKDSGKKTSAIDPKEYWSTLGSLFTLKYYLKKYLALNNIENDYFRDSWSGFRYNDIDVYKEYNSKEEIEATRKFILNGKYEIKIDAIAIRELADIMALARERNIKIFAYYYPVHKKIFETKLYQQEINKYRKQMIRLLTSDDVILDFNVDEFNYIRDDYDTYSDGSHLSAVGANKVINVIQEYIYKYNLSVL